jgi:heme ABC exporter ATP-binding subunit CcmA
MITPDGAAPVVELRDVHVALGDTPVLRGITLAVAAGQSVALVGPNGAGKSTLLRTLAGLIRPALGEVRIGGQALGPSNAAARRLVGLVGHQSMLYPELTARENLRFYGRLYGLSSLDRRVDRGLARLDMARHADRPVGAMSRGMIQRLALARALLHEPPLLLLDEPETGLDARANGALTRIVRERRASQATVLASHDLGRVLELADTIAFLRAGQIVETLATAGLTVVELQAHYVAALARRIERGRPNGGDSEAVALSSRQA